MDYCKYRGGRQETSAVSWTRLFYSPAYSPAPDWYYSLALHSLVLEYNGITSPRTYPARGQINILKCDYRSGGFYTQLEVILAVTHSCTSSSSKSALYIYD